MSVEQVKALREAFVSGARYGVGDAGGSYLPTYRAEAARRYPMPFVAVPRVVEVNECEYRVIGSTIETRPRGANDDDWSPWLEIEPRLVPSLIDLLSNPTCQCPADESPNA